MLRRPTVLTLCLLTALFACKGSKKSPETTPTPAPAPTPTAKTPFTPGVSQLQKVCDGQGVAGLDELPREKASAAAFVRKEPGAELEHIKYDDVVAYKDGLASSLDRATLVACIEVKKKKKLRSCEMEALDPGKLGGTIHLYSYDYVITLRETKTGKVLSEEKKSFGSKKCPAFHSFKKSEEDLEPPFGVIASSAATRYRDGK